MSDLTSVLRRMKWCSCEADVDKLMILHRYWVALISRSMGYKPEPPLNVGPHFCIEANEVV